MQKAIKFIKRFPFAMLLAVQLISILFYGMMTDSKTSHIIFNCIGLIVPILAVWTVYRTPAANWVGFVLVSASIGTSLLALFGGQAQLLVWAHFFESLLYFYAATSLVMYMFKDDVVTLDELFAAAATFTLLVWGFALAYSVCQQVYPGSVLAAVNPNEPRSWIELLFMSFSIQSSTGVGDVIPVSGPARAIGSLQIFAGVMYIAIVVSRLVGLAASTKK
jgi:predicted small integral membrane protein